MTDAQQREAARQFYYKWNGKGKEDEDARSYWIDVLVNIFGMSDVTDHVQFEKKVAGDKSKKRIDVYLPETHVLIEQKSLGIPLDKPQAGHEGKTPYQQAKEYDNLLPYEERARWIITSNFSEIWIYDMSVMQPEPVKIALADLPSKYHMLDFLLNKEVKKVTDEMKISLQAGELVGKLYDAFLKQYKDPESEETLKSLNKLCVRIVFCLYAEDADVFGKKSMFHDYMAQFDAAHARKGLRDLFRVLNQKPEERDPYLADDDPMLAAFPYVNGGLFDGDDIEIPPFTDEIMDLLLRKASDDFDWSEISPTIFGAVFESTLNPETRRSGGMHYTSLENIHKVIDPLFLDDLKAEFEEIKQISVVKTKEKKLHALQDKLASLSFLDPSAGSGNFLTESFLQLRKIENEIIRELTGGQMLFGEAVNPIKVSISQFYGIEINDFAVTVARTALWIAENQMMKETEYIVHMQLDFLPLKTNAYIVEGNALRINWEDVVPKDKLNYIMGNPPFSAGRRMGDSQRSDMTAVAYDFPKNGDMDYVCAWYIVASRFMQNTKIKAGFVSTSSITQGEQVILLWKRLFEHYHLEIQYAIRSFNWQSEAKIQAGVHCVIIEFLIGEGRGQKYIVDGESVTPAEHINGYLMDTPDTWIDGQKKPLSDAPIISNGSKPLDNAICAFTPEEKAGFIEREPKSAPYFYRYMGSREFINNIERYFLLINRIPPNLLSHMPLVLDRLAQIKQYRLSSNSAPTRKLADTPSKFHFENMPDSNYLVIPQTSSGRRRYVPIGFLTPDVLVNNKLQVMKDGGLYEFGVLSSNVHNSWLRTVAGRFRDDFTYSVSVVYNTFVWPEEPTAAQKALVEKTAQEILNVRNQYPEASLADLYDSLTMPDALRKAHHDNDRAVMQAYGMPIKETDEAACVAWLMRLYQEKVAELEKTSSVKSRKAGDKE